MTKKTVVGVCLWIACAGAVSVSAMLGATSANTTVRRFMRDDLRVVVERDRSIGVVTDSAGGILSPRELQLRCGAMTVSASYAL